MYYATKVNGIIRADLPVHIAAVLPVTPYTTACGLTLTKDLRMVPCLRATGDIGGVWARVSHVPPGATVCKVCSG